MEAYIYWADGSKSMGDESPLSRNLSKSLCNVLPDPSTLWVFCRIPDRIRSAKLAGYPVGSPALSSCCKYVHNNPFIPESRMSILVPV